MKNSIKFICLPVLAASLLTSCNLYNAKSEKQYVLDNSSLPIGDSYDSFFCKNQLIYQEKKEGIDIYKVEGDIVIDEGENTLFYFKDGINIGFKTSDPKYGFDILGNRLYSLLFSSLLINQKEELYTNLYNRAWRPVNDDDKVFKLSNHPGARKEENGITHSYGWSFLTYKISSDLIINMEYEFRGENGYTNNPLVALEVIFK